MQIKTLLSLYIGFFTIGIISNMAGPLIPYIENIFHFDESQAGLIISANFMGFMFSVVLGSLFAEKIGKRNFIIVGSILIVIMMCIAILTSSYYLLVFALLFCGIGFGIYEIGINSYAIEFFTVNKIDSDSSLNIIHFFFGLGAILAPVVIKYTFSITGYKTIFVVVIFLASFCGILLFFSENIKTTNTDKSIISLFKNIFTNPFLWLCGLALMIYVGIEVTANGWLPKYWNFKYQDYSISPAITSSIFWGALTFGRIIAAFIIKLMSLKKYLIFSTMLLIVSMIGWVFVNDSYLNIVIIIFIGIALSGMFPALMNIAAKGREDVSAAITSFMIIFASIGGGLIPWMSGFVFKYNTMVLLPLLLTILSFMLILMMFLVLRKYRNKTI